MAEDKKFVTTEEMMEALAKAGVEAKLVTRETATGTGEAVFLPGIRKGTTPEPFDEESPLRERRRLRVVDE